MDVQVLHKAERDDVLAGIRVLDGPQGVEQGGFGDGGWCAHRARGGSWESAAPVNPEYRGKPARSQRAAERPVPSKPLENLKKLARPATKVECLDPTTFAARWAISPPGGPWSRPAT